MNKKLHDIGDLFKTALGDNREPVPTKIWDAVSNHLDKKQTIAIQKKYDRLKRTFAALLLIGTTAAVYTLYNYKITQKPAVAKEAVAKEESVKRPDINPERETASIDKMSFGKKKAPVIMFLKNRNTDADGKKVVAPTLFEINAAKQSMPIRAYNDEKQRNTTEMTSNSNFFKNPYHPAAITIHGSRKQEPALLKEHYAPGQPYVQQRFAGHQAQAILQGSEPVLSKGGVTISFDAATRRFNNTTSKTKGVSPFSLTVFFAPDIALDPLNDNDDDPASTTDTDETESKEQFASSFNTGFLLNYGLTKNWSLQSGITFSNFTTTIAPKTIFTHTNNQGSVSYKLRCSAGNSYITTKSGMPAVAGDSAESLGSQTVLQYVAVPLALYYNIPKGRFRFSAGLGLSANFLIEGKVMTNISNGTDDEEYENDISGLKPTHLNGLISLGAEYRLNKKIAVSVTPIRRFALNSINRDIPVKSYQNFLSVATGLHITF